MITYLNYFLQLVIVFINSNLWNYFLLPVLCLGILSLLVKVVYTLCTISSRA